jgi:hypothetical protein
MATFQGFVINLCQIEWCRAGRSTGLTKSTDLPRNDVQSRDSVVGFLLRCVAGGIINATSYHSRGWRRNPRAGQWADVAAGQRRASSIRNGSNNRLVFEKLVTT